MSTEIQIRWMIRRDMPEVLAIESASFPIPWSEEDFLSQLRKRNCIAMVAELGDTIVGFMVYELHKTSLELVNFAVTPSHRHKGVATEMVDRLKRKLSQQRRESIYARVAEMNIGMQMFLKSQGFEAIEIERGFFDGPQDAYRFAYSLGEHRGANRIKALMGDCDE